MNLKDDTPKISAKDAHRKLSSTESKVSTVLTDEPNTSGKTSSSDKVPNQQPRGSNVFKQLFRMYGIVDTLQK